MPKFRIKKVVMLNGKEAFFVQRRVVGIVWYTLYDMWKHYPESHTLKRTQEYIHDQEQAYRNRKVIKTQYISVDTNE